MNSTEKLAQYKNLQTRLLGILSGAAALVAVGACHALAATTLTVGAATFPDSLMTGVSSATSESLILQTYDTLVARDNEGNFVPSLAENWEPFDANTWRFHLRKGVKFHDGKELTAQDVKFTIDRVIDPQTGYGFLGRISQVSGAVVVDPYTVDIKTKSTFPTLPKGLTDVVIEAEHYYKEVGADVVKRQPMGTGPFIAKKWVPGDRYELEANKAYWNGAPKVDHLVIRQIPEAATRIAALLSGEVDIIEEVPIDSVEEVDASGVAKIHSASTTVGLVLTYDVRKPPFDNPKVREALDYAVDKQLILKEILKDKAELLDGQLVTKKTLGYNPDIRARPYDPEKAKRLLKEANFDFKTPIAIMTQAGKYVSDVDICNAIAGMLLEVGITANINVVESGVYLKQWAVKEMGPIYMVGWYSQGDADFATVWYTDGGKRTTWTNPEYERLFKEARSTLDESARRKIYARMMQILHDENPSMFLYGLPAVYGAASKVKGFKAPYDKILRVTGVTFE
ncbi:hypothetical protein JS562_16520 [Agrobacterium sp. S2]|nr:hypothetical protein [Agrobacterium sp. S2]